MHATLNLKQLKLSIIVAAVIQVKSENKLYKSLFNYKT